MFVVWPIIKSNRQQKKIEETLSSIPNLTIKVEIEKIKEIQCLVVYAKGWINSKRDHSVSGNISLSLIDKTEDPGSLVLTSAEGLVKFLIRIFSINPRNGIKSKFLLS